MAQTLSRKGAYFMRLHEGFRAKWYLDPVGIPTIGIGFTWRSAAFRQWWKEHKPGQAFARGASLTRTEAEGALMFLCEHEYGKAVVKFYGKKVPQHVFDGTVSPVYNLGPGSLKWKWAAAAKKGDLRGAAAKLRVTGTTARGRKLPGLVRRRKEEALLLEKGIYTGVDGGHSSGRIDALSDGILERGEAGPAVAKLIRDLHKLGHYDGILDDRFGYGTQAAVMGFQQGHSITRDGRVGPETFKAISKALAGLEVPPAPSVRPLPDKRANPPEHQQPRTPLAAFIAVLAAIFGGTNAK